MRENLATVLETVADELWRETAVLQGEHRRTWQELDERAARLAGALGARGIGQGSRVGIGLWNGADYLEALYALVKLEAVPFNVNYRYRARELAEVLADSGATGLIFDSSNLATVHEARAAVPGLRVLVRVHAKGDGPADAHVPADDGEEFEQLVAEGPAQPRTLRENGEWMLFTGGTTGRPKAVVSRHSTVFRSCVPNGISKFDLPAPESLAGLVEAVRTTRAVPDRLVTLIPTPLMHGTGIYTALGTLVAGGRVIFPASRSYDPHELARLVHEHRVTDTVIVGDVFARPLVAALDEAAASATPYDLSSLQRVLSVGAVFSAETKDGLLRHADAVITDVIVASEGGPFALSLTRRGEVSPTSVFMLAPFAKLLDEDGAEIPAGSGRTGLLAAPTDPDVQYLDAVQQSESTFREYGGVRYCIPGDLATMGADGTLVLQGRGSRVINTGGEKVFAEEVEQAILRHPQVRDVLVVGVPDERFGQRISAVLAVEPGATLTAEDVRATVGQVLADYKRPRSVFFVPEVRRSPVGKADLAWARGVALGLTAPQASQAGPR